MRRRFEVGLILDIFGDRKSGDLHCLRWCVHRRGGWLPLGDLGCRGRHHPSTLRIRLRRKVFLGLGFHSAAEVFITVIGVQERIIASSKRATRFFTRSRCRVAFLWPRPLAKTVDTFTDQGRDLRNLRTRPQKDRVEEKKNQECSRAPRRQHENQRAGNKPTEDSTRILDRSSRIKSGVTFADMNKTGQRKDNPKATCDAVGQG